MIQTNDVTGVFSLNRALCHDTGFPVNGVSEKSPSRCPNPDCDFHDADNIPEGQKWYRLHGMYSSKQHGRIPRYKCTGCMKTFTSRTEDKMKWYLHDDSSDVINMGFKWLSGSTLSELANEYGVSIQKVRTRLGRIKPSMLEKNMKYRNFAGCCRSVGSDDPDL